MARFRYSMQSILDIKLKMETQVKQEFGAARAALDGEEEKLQQLVERKQDYEKKAKELLSGTLRLRDIEDNKMAILCMDEYIAAQQLRVQAAEKKLEETRERLTEVMMERKTHETLKEKAFQQFLEDEKRKAKRRMNLPAIPMGSGRRMTEAAW